MSGEAGFAAQKKRVTAQLGEAVFAAVGLMVRQYLSAGAEEYAGEESNEAARWDAEEAEAESAAVNESFDMERYRQLGGAEEEAARIGAPRPAGSRPTEKARVEGKTAAKRIEEANRAEARGEEEPMVRRAAEGNRAEELRSEGEMAVRHDAEESRAAKVRGGEEAAVRRTAGARPAEAVRIGEETMVRRDAGEVQAERMRAWEEAEPMPMERTERERDAKEVRAAAERTEPDASGEAVPNVAVRQEVTLLTAQEEMRSSSARAVSDEIERDARRYDSGFYLY